MAHSIKLATTSNIAPTVSKLVVTFLSPKATIVNVVAFKLSMVATLSTNGFHPKKVAATGSMRANISKLVVTFLSLEATNVHLVVFFLMGATLSTWWLPL